MWGSSGPGQGEEEQQGQGRLRRLSGEASSLPIIAHSYALSKNNNSKSLPSPRPQFTGVLPTLLSHPGASHHPSPTFHRSPTSPTSKHSRVPSETPGHLGCLSLPQLHKAPRLTEVPTYILPLPYSEATPSPHQPHITLKTHGDAPKILLSPTSSPNSWGSP